MSPVSRAEIVAELDRFLDGAGAAYRRVVESDGMESEPYHVYAYGVLEGLILACQYPEWAMYWSTLFHDDACSGGTDWMRRDPECANSELMTMSPEIVPVR